MKLSVLLIDVLLLLDVFNLVFIIAVIYKLIKSLILIISSYTIPTVLIIQLVSLQ